MHIQATCLLVGHIWTGRQWR